MVIISQITYVSLVDTVETGMSPWNNLVLIVYAY